MSFALKIWNSSRRNCIKLAMARYGFSEDEADEIFQDTVKICLENESTFDPKRGTLDYWVKLRMNSYIKNNLKRKKRFGEIIDDQEQYEHNEKQSDFIQSPMFRGAKIKLEINGLKTKNDNKLIFITTENENEVRVGDSIFLSGLTNLSDLTIDRLRNKYGDDIFIEEVINKKTFTIRVNFEHEISSIGHGGETAYVEFVRKTSYLRPELPTFRLSGDLKENEKLMDIQQERCLQKLKPKERIILEYNLFPVHNNESMFLGFKDPKSPEPKFRNDGSSLQHGDKYYIQDSDELNLKDENWRIFLNRSWVNAEKKEIKIKPMTTDRIAEKLQMAAGTVGELLSKAKKQFALCMQEAGYA